MANVVKQKKLTRKDMGELVDTMTPKQAAFFAEYLQTGNGVKSAMKAYGCDYGSAGVLAHENLQKLKNPVKQFLEHKGIDLLLLTKVLVDGMKADKRDQFSGEMYPDHKVRILAVERLAKWLGVESEAPVVAIQNTSEGGPMEINFVDADPNDFPPTNLAQETKPFEGETVEGNYVPEEDEKIKRRIG